MTSESLAGLDLASLDRYLSAAGVPRSGQLRGRLISGGRSNLTFEVYDDASRWALRRPPLHGLTPSAHDVAREYRVVAALADTAVPVAQTVTVCDDDSVLGAPFAVWEYVDGQIVRTREQLQALGGPDVITACVNGLIRVLADLHAVDPDAVGLSDFGRPAGYLERQIRRWGGQWQYVRSADESCDADVQRLHSALGEALPRESRASIVHGDYRIDNTILDNEDPAVVLAVLDWEMSTLGDPLADVALMCIYRDMDTDLIAGAWTSPLLPTADEMAHRYSTMSGQPLAHWPFYIALAYFKLGIIAAGVAFRDQLAGADASGKRVNHSIAPLIAAGLRALS